MVSQRTMAPVTDVLFEARARVLHDLAARGLDTAAVVSVVDEVVTARQWWVDEWPDGAAFVTCLVAQDVQEALLEPGRPVAAVPGGARPGRGRAGPHELRVGPGPRRGPALGLRGGRRRGRAGRGPVPGLI